jgi:heterodisulfide reductase subunit B
MSAGWIHRPSRDTQRRTWAYYPGCSLESSSKEFDMSSRAVLSALGCDLVELDGWTCCGGSSAHAVDHVLGAALPARNLRLAEELGLDVVMPCPACSARHISSYHELQDPARAAKINATLDAPAKGTSKVLTILDALDQAMADIEKGDLPFGVDMKVVPYYGCLLTRPRVGAGAYTNEDEEPVIMDRILEKVGATVLPWGFKTECCGASLSFTVKDAVLVNSARILAQAVDAGAEAIVLACQLCEQNLDLRRKQIAKHSGRLFGLPVYYVTELVGAALGLAPDELGVDLHAVEAVEPLKAAVTPQVEAVTE